MILPQTSCKYHIMKKCISKVKPLCRSQQQKATTNSLTRQVYQREGIPVGCVHRGDQEQICKEHRLTIFSAVRLPKTLNFLSLGECS